MPLTRPIVEVYQDYASMTTSPGTPDLNCLVVGPCYFIQDFPTDKANLGVGAFVKATYTKDAPCDASGDSEGRPNPGATFLTLSEPPNITAAPGALLDADSVEVVFDGALIQLTKGTNGVVTENSTVFTSSGADFVTAGVVAGDRLVLTDTAGGDDATVVYTVNAVPTSTPTTLVLNDEVSSDDIAKIGETSIRFRVEHIFVETTEPQVIDTDYYTVTGQEITIKTGVTGLLLTYNDSTYPVNYATQMYVGYRALRQDLQDVLTLEDSDAIEAGKVGRVDERNPLAVGAFVAFQNTGTSIQVFGVVSDDLAGQTSARDRVTTRNDIYAVTPVTDGLGGSDWLSVITMWKAHCVSYANPTKSKFRVVLGSYDTLPTEKSSAPPSLVGSTIEDPSESNNSMFIDPADATDFLVAQVGASHLLDITKNSDAYADLVTLENQKTIFTVGYTGAKAVLGAVGKKRLRVAVGSAFTTKRLNKTACYAVRGPILKAEGVATSAIKADATGATWGTDGGGSPKARVTKTGAFTNVLVGDVAHVSDGGTSAHNDGFIVRGVDVSGNYIDLESTNVTTDTVAVQVYRPLAYKNLATVVGTTHQVTTTGNGFAAVAVGDICFVLQSGTAGNKGMWVVSNKIDNNTVVLALPSSFSMTNGTADTNVAFFRPQTSNGTATITVRKRLTRLRDDTASFLTTVNVGENIEIPYPVDVDIDHWDTATTQWPVETIVSNQTLEATLTSLEELAPEDFVNGFSRDCAYRISIDLDRTAQVTELNTITTGLANSRCIMVWPNACKVAGVTNKKTGVQNVQKGQYLACAVGGMTAGLPSHQGFTFIGVGGIEQIFNSNFYFTDDQIDALSENGWYVFLQDSESSAPYSAHEVTTDTSVYEMGEYMNVKNFDYIASFYRDLMHPYLGKYNIYSETLDALRDTFNSGTDFLRLRIYPKIGAPLLDGEIITLSQRTGEDDGLGMYAEVSLPRVLNKIGLHLRA